MNEIFNGHTRPNPLSTDNDAPKPTTNRNKTDSTPSATKTSTSIHYPNNYLPQQLTTKPLSQGTKVTLHAKPLPYGSPEIEISEVLEVCGAYNEITGP